MKHQISTIEIIFGILAFLGIWYHVKCNQICYFIHIFSALKNSENQYSSAQSFVSEILGEMEVLSPLRKITKIQKVGIRRNGKAFLS